MIASPEKFTSGRITRYLPEFVYGSIDGTITTFAIIAGVAGAGLSPAIVIILGFSNVLADGFSMASSNYLSEQSHQAQNPNQEKQNPLKTALATFLSFVSVGSIPVVSYLVAGFIPLFSDHQFFFTAVCTGITFAGIGAMRGIIAGKNPLRASIETLVVGTIAALVAFFVGGLIENFV